MFILNSKNAIFYKTKKRASPDALNWIYVRLRFRAVFLAVVEFFALAFVPIRDRAEISADPVIDFCFTLTRFLLHSELLPVSLLLLN